MIALSNLALTALWHDAELIHWQFVWATDGQVTALCTTVLNPEEDLWPLQALGLDTRSLTISFRDVDEVESILHSNYAARPTIDDWSARTSADETSQWHTITTVSGCRFHFQCQSVWLQSSNP